MFIYFIYLACSSFENAWSGARAGDMAMGSHCLAGVLSENLAVLGVAGPCLPGVQCSGESWPEHMQTDAGEWRKAWRGVVNDSSKMIYCNNVRGSSVLSCPSLPPRAKGQ